MKLFSSIANKSPKKNKFDLSSENKLSMKIGDLVPILVKEILPGDSWQVTSEIMMRLSPMIAPVMHRMNVYTHYFFVPNRILWDEWEDFITGGEDGTSLPVPPQYQTDEITQPILQEKKLSDYLGFPTLVAAEPVNILFSALPFRAYQTIFNEYYRDQNLTDKIEVLKTGGLQPSADLVSHMGVMRQRAWEKDYFTSALPWTQRGPEVTIPINTTVDTVIDKATGVGALGNPNLGTSSPSGTLVNSANVLQELELQGDGAQATINDLRRSVRLQEWLEKNARGGARYIEQLLSHWGRAPQDARLQRPEYLGGGKQPVTISEVLATVGGETAPQGEMAGHGISVGNTNGFKKTFDEHGYVIGICSVLPTTAYYQGIPKHFQRVDKLDYAWPEFAQLGEQEIKNREIFFDGNNAGTNTFGYTPRYSEYKYGISEVHGEFKSSLDFWHMGRKFASLPALNTAFVTVDPDDPELKRIFAVTDAATDDLYVQIYHDISALRALPYYGTPTL